VIRDRHDALQSVARRARATVAACTNPGRRFRSAANPLLRIATETENVASTAPLFNYLAPSESADEKMDCEVRLRQGYGGQPSRGLPTVAHAEVDKRERRLVSLNFASWNQLATWLTRLDSLRRAA
jgi:hypothetical protein